jgi:preprotein translocase subunit SecD
MKTSTLLPGLALLLSASCPAASAASPLVDLSLVLQVHPGTGASAGIGDAVARTAQVIRERVDKLGLGNAEVTLQGDRIEVALAGVDDPERVRRVLLAQDALELRFARFPSPWGAASQEAVLANYNGQLPPDLEILAGNGRADGGKAGTVYWAVEKRPVITGADFASARPSLGPLDMPTVEFRLKPDAAKVFSQATGDNVGANLAIVLNGRVLSAPKLQSRISDTGIIEGGFSKIEAEDLAIVLGSGTLPARVSVVRENALPASFWRPRRRNAALLLAGAVALVLVLVVLSRASQRPQAH